MTLRLEHTVTSGTFSLDGGTWEVDNNVWVLGNDSECLVIDAPHDAAPIIELVGGRRVSAVVCTHAHDDHITVARELSVALRAPVLLHPDDNVLWRQTYPDFGYGQLSDGEQLTVAGSPVTVLHTPGHSPGAVCLLVPDLNAVFTGDTLFHGGPGATGRSFSDRDTIIASIRDRLLTLPGRTVVHTGHGADTTIDAERASFADQV